MVGDKTLERYAAIRKLRAEKKTYSEIAGELHIARSTVQYALDPRRKLTVDRCVKSWMGRNPLAKKIRDFRQRAKRLGRDYGRFNQNDLRSLVGTDPRCYLTGDTLDLSRSETYTLDHITPLSRGGDGTLSNLGLARSDVNRVKNDKTLEEFLDLCTVILRHHGFVVMKSRE